MENENRGNNRCSEAVLRKELGLNCVGTAYDKKLISEMLSVLSNTRVLNQGLNAALQMVAEHYQFDAALICEFIGNGLAKVTNCWSADRLSSSEENDIINVESWDSFLTGYNEQGIFSVKNVAQSSLSEYDRSFLLKKHVHAFVSVLIFGNEKPIAYLALEKRCVMEKESETERQTLLQAAKIFSAFLESRIQRRKDMHKITELSVDELTGLLNFAAFQRNARKQLANREKEKVYAIVASDISNFSSLNKNYGYQEGDRILKEFGQMLRKTSLNGELVCRGGADRFYALLVSKDRSQAESEIKRVNHEFTTYLTQRYPLRGLCIATGIRYVTGTEENIRLMTDEANYARKNAKTIHGDNLGVFSEELQKKRENAIRIVESVEGAIRDGMVEMFLQPKFSISKRTTIGAEALVRWRNPDGTYKFPDQFIPILEETGLITELDLSIYRQVLQTLARWRTEHRALIPISVNTSRVDFEEENFAERLIALAAEYHISPCYIEFEVTEGAMIFHTERLYRQLNQLRDAGFRIDMDDFGTGQSSLNMLIDAPVDIIKVDKSFLFHFRTKQEKDYIRKICELIHVARKEGIFEGVETEEQMELLQNCGCDNAQGYFYSKPIPVSAFERSFLPGTAAVT